MSFSPGMLSVFCALGTVIGLALFIIGLFMKKQILRSGGIIFFLISFIGLFYLIAKHGKAIPDTANTVNYTIPHDSYALLLSFETTVYVDDEVVGVWNRLQSLPQPLYLRRSQDSLFLMHNQNSLVTRLTKRKGDKLELISQDTTSHQLLVGTYKIKKVGNSEWLWEGSYLSNDGIFYRDVILVNSPRPVGQ